MDVRGLGSQALVVGWVAGAAEGAAMAAAGVRRAAQGAWASLLGPPLQRWVKTRPLLFDLNASQCPIYAALLCT